MRRRNVSIGIHRATLAAMALACLAGGCATPAPTGGGLSLIETRQQTIECLHRAIEYKPNPVIRAAAIEGFQVSGCADGLPWIRSALLDEHAGARFAACVALGMVRDETARSALGERVEDQDHSVRVAAMFALHRLGDTTHTGRMSGYLLKHEDDRVRRNTAFVLGRFEEEGVIKLLARAMKDKDIGTQNMALEGMARLGNPQARQQLVFTANSGVGSEEVFAIGALSVLKDPRHEEMFRSKTLDDEAPHLETRLAAARALAIAGHDDGYALALRSLRFNRPSVHDEEDTPEGQILRVRQLAAAALGAMGKVSALPELVRMMESNGDARLQVSAATAVLQICAHAVEDALAFPPADELRSGGGGR